MVDFVRNIIKLTNFPFSYSIIGLFLFRTGVNSGSYDFSSLVPSVPSLLLMSIVGTTLSITNPIGNCIKFYYKSKLQFKPKFDLNYYTDEKSLQSLEHVPQRIRSKFYPVKEKDEKYIIESVLNTNWITYQIDKIVSCFYFLFILIALLIITIKDYLTFMVQIYISDNQTNLAISTNLFWDNEKILGSNDLITLILSIIFFMIILGIINIIDRKLKELSLQTEYVSYYFVSKEIILPSLNDDIIYLEVTYRNNVPENKQLIKKQLEEIYKELNNSTTQFEKFLADRDWGMGKLFSNIILRAVLDYTLLKDEHLKKGKNTNKSCFTNYIK